MIERGLIATIERLMRETQAAINACRDPDTRESMRTAIASLDRARQLLRLRLAAQDGLLGRFAPPKRHPQD